ncbi:MAG: HDOD domain-containing protein [Gammaproteobacteria bacterium]
MVHFPKLFSKNKSANRKAQQPQPNNDSTISHCSTPDFVDTRQLPLAVLKQFVPIRNLDDSSANLLLHSIPSYSAGSIVFVKGQQIDSVYYLLEGTIELMPDSESKYQITSGTPHAHLPLNSGKLCGASAMALTDVKILTVSAELIQLWSRQSIQEPNTVELIDLELPEHFDDNRFFSNFIQMYREDKLVLPSLPTVALKLKQAMNEETSIAETAQIIQIDPAITAKLIQISNSALYSPVASITNCHEAVTRLGLNATRTLVMGISLKQLFQSKDRKLMKAMQTLWRNSLYLSSLCFILAEESAAINPEDALLAGLISDIGAIPLLHFAEQNPDQYSDLTEMEQAIRSLSAPIGMLVLHTLGFSEQLTQIPRHAEDWYFDAEDELSLIDIVILAKLHSFIGQARAQELPYINSIPAYSKLNEGKLTPDFSLNVLQKTQQRIALIMQVLS